MATQVLISHAADSETQAWVGTLITQLKTLIAMRPGGGQITIGDAEARAGQYLLAFLSPDYLASEQGQNELARLLEAHAMAGNGRVFLVELLPSPSTARPAAIQTITALPFWDDGSGQPETLGWPEPNPKTHQQYWDKLAILANLIVQTVQNPPPPRAIPTAETSRSEQGFHVFLSHNSQDKPAVRELAAALERRGVRVWIDEDQLIPGRPWQEAMEQAIDAIPSAAVLLGGSGFGPWESQEMQACIQRFVKRELPSVIPVLLPGAPAKPKWPLFLDNFTYVDLRDGLSDAGINRLVWGITGKKHAPPDDQSKGPLSIVINAAEHDQDLGIEVQKLLDDLEVEATLAALPAPDMLPERYFELLDDLVGNSRAVLIVYGLAPKIWMQSQHMRAKRILAERRKGIWGGLLDGPPPDKLGHGLSGRSLARLMLLDCRQGLNPAELKRFVDSLRGGGDV